MSLAISLRAPEGDKKEFSGATSLFSVSMGIDKILVQGKCLEKIVEAINPIFSKCDIVISDTLQRFNLMLRYPDMSEEKALQVAADIGNNWLEKNENILKKLNIPFKIYKWNDWLNHQDFQRHYEYVCNLMNEEPDFAISIMHSIKEYFKRKTKQDDSDVLLNKAMPLAYNFVLEEAAVMLLWCDVGYDFELHPSNRSAALTYVHKLYYKDKNQRYLKQCRIKILGKHEEITRII
jgi:hypothetical protein